MPQKCVEHANALGWLIRDWRVQRSGMPKLFAIHWVEQHTSTAHLAVGGEPHNLATAATGGSGGGRQCESAARRCSQLPQTRHSLVSSCCAKMLC